MVWDLGVQGAAKTGIENALNLMNLLKCAVFTDMEMVKKTFWRVNLLCR